MRLLALFAPLVAVPALAVACGGSSSDTPSAPSTPFAGTWQCTGSDTLNFTVPMVFSRQVNRVSTMVIRDNGDGTITATRSSDAGADCVTKSAVDGASATLQAGQTCDVGGLTLKLTSGSGQVTGNSLVSARTYDFAGTLTFGPDGGAPQTMNVAGQGSSSDNCTKQ
jgi:hypothetical protein